MFHLYFDDVKGKKKKKKKPKAALEALKEKNSVGLAKPWKHILLRRKKHSIIDKTEKWVFNCIAFLYLKKHKDYFTEF